MGSVIEELYFDRLPVDLFRHGSATSPQLVKPRMMPPRQPGQPFDVIVFKKDASDWVRGDSGGISVFNKPNPLFGSRWWKLPKGAKIPSGLRVSRDKGVNPVTGQIHFTIRPVNDMPLSIYILALKELARRAAPMFGAEQSKG